MDKRSLWQRKALKGSRLRLLIWGVLAAFLVVVVFRLEREFRIKIPRGELFMEPEVLGNAGFVQDGHLTDEGLAALRSQMPYADLTSFNRDRRLININDLFTVNLLTSYIRWKLGTGGEAEKDVQPPARVSPTPIHQ